MNALATLFGYPNGICTGNLIASAIWAIPALCHFAVRVRKTERQVQGWFAEVHRRMDEAGGTLPADGPGAQGADTSLADGPRPTQTSGPSSPRWNDV